MACNKHIVENQDCAACMASALRLATRENERAAAHAAQAYEAMEAAHKEAELNNWLSLSAAEEASREAAEQTRLLRAEANWREFRTTADGQYVEGWLTWARALVADRQKAWTAAHAEWVAELVANDPTDRLTAELRPELDRDYRPGRTLRTVADVASLASVVGYWVLFDHVLFPRSNAGGSGLFGGLRNELGGLVHALLMLLCAAGAAFVTFLVLRMVLPSDGKREKDATRASIAQAGEAYWRSVAELVGQDPRESTVPWEDPEGTTVSLIERRIRNVEQSTLPAIEVDPVALPSAAPIPRLPEDWWGSGMNTLLLTWASADLEGFSPPRRTR